MKPAAVYRKMLSHYGEQRWWPVTDSGSAKPTYRKRASLSERQMLEICIGAILTQNTAWKNVSRAMEALAKAKMVGCKKIAGSRHSRLASLVKPSGYYNQKAKRLRLFCRHLQENYRGSISKMLSKPLPELREELLSLHGIGNETADDILLYAAEKPSFVVDAYTTRFAERFFGKKEIRYVEVKRFFEAHLAPQVPLFQEFHALLVEHGKRFCKRQPLCSECFLEKDCRFCSAAGTFSAPHK